MKTKLSHLLPRVAGVLLLGIPFLPCTAQIETPSNPSYVAIDLGTLGGADSAAYGINDSGQIAGSAGVSDSYYRFATVFSGTGSGNVGFPSDVDTTSGGYSINATGQMVGFGLPWGGSNHAAFFSEADGSVGLGGLGGTFSEALSINNGGQIVGQALLSGNGSNSNLRATLFSGTGSANTDLGGLGGTGSGATDINDYGMIVGWAYTSDYLSRATLFRRSGGGNIDLGTIGGTESGAFGVNGAGQIVGWATTSDGFAHATLFSGTGSGNIDLDPLRETDSRAKAINGSGQIVGSFMTSFMAPPGAERHGFLYSGGTFRDVNDLVQPGSGLTDITIEGYGKSINNWGQIVGQGKLADGRTHAVLLNPVDPLTSLSDTMEVMRETMFVNGMDYGKFTPTGDPEYPHTTVSLLGGTAGSGGQGTYGLNRDVMVVLLHTSELSLLAGNVVVLSGTEADIIVLQITYDEALVISIFGAEANAMLGSFDSPGQKWRNAVDDNIGGGANFVSGAYNPATDFHLGYYGIDVGSNTVWAVVNHDGSFAVTSAVPEPGSMGVAVGVGLFCLAFARRFRAGTRGHS